MTAAKKIEEIRDQLIHVTHCNGETELESVSVANGRMRYRLFQCNCEVDEKTVLCFGIEVICTLFGEQESEKISDITTKYEIAKELFDTVSENLVTPLVFKDVVEDFIIQKYSYQ